MRIYEPAKELGITSKELMDHPKKADELAKSPSPPFEPSVVQQIREKFATAPKTKKAGAKPATKASKSSMVKSATKKPGVPKAEAADIIPRAAVPKGDALKPGTLRPRTKKAGATTKPGTRKSAEGGAPKPVPRRANGPCPAHPDDLRPGGPRPGNDPYASLQGIPRPGGSSGSRPDAPRPDRSGNDGPRPGVTRQGVSGSDGPRPGASRPGGNRPNPGMMPGQANFARNAASGNGGGERIDRDGRGRSSARFGGAGAGIGGGALQSNGGGLGGSRGNGRDSRDSTPGALGRGGGRSQHRCKSKCMKRQEYEQQNTPIIGGMPIPRGDGTQVRIRQGASPTDLVEKIDVNLAALVTVLFALGEMVTATQSLDQDTFEVLGTGLGYGIKVVSPKNEDRELLGSFDISLEVEKPDDAENMVPRPPIVTAMGHVDHGKTKLLDAIRRTDAVDIEHGDATQHIGACQATVKAEDDTVRPTTFIDTPGHEAFTAIRTRGAQVTDTTILVVAVDDGIMPRMVEAIDYAQTVGVPIVVVMNKVDKDTANLERIYSQLTEHGPVVEEYGSGVMFVNISAKQHRDIRELLEIVLLTADAAPTLETNSNTDVRGVTIEANLDKGRGAVATMLVQYGTLHMDDSLVVDSSHDRVRTMFDDSGNDVSETGPSTPIAVLGLTSTPRTGDSFLAASDDRMAHQIADKCEAVERQALPAKHHERASPEDFDKALAEGEVDTLNLVTKGDVSGTVEALENSLPHTDVDDGVALRTVHRGAGTITQNDASLTTVDNAVIIGFNVRSAGCVVEMANTGGVETKYYSVIHSTIDDTEAALEGMFKSIYEGAQPGTAEVHQVFHSGKFDNIAGSIVRSGVTKRNTKARLVRDGVVVADNLEIASLHREKDGVTEVRKGYECGITLGHRGIAEGDIIETQGIRGKARD